MFLQLRVNARFVILACTLVSTPLLGTGKTLYVSDSFTVTDQAVYQGDDYAVAVSPTDIRSTYEVVSQPEVRKVVVFKFSINGHDNERPPFQNHRVSLNPIHGAFVTPVYRFGEPDPGEAAIPDDVEEFLEGVTECVVVFRADLRPVLAQLEENGYYETYDGSRIGRDEFKGVFIAGGTAPLTWEFETLPDRPEFKLRDPDRDGTYEVTVRFTSVRDRPVDNEGRAMWKLRRDISRYPRLVSNHLLVDAVYNLSLEELVLDLRGHRGT